MLTLEVVKILKKAIILSLALAMAVASHLRPNLDFTVEGRRINAHCSPAAAKLAQEAALAAAEEILAADAAPAEFKRHLHLSLRPGSELAPELTDALLQGSPGIISASCVYVKGRRMGAVADANEFRQSLARYIENTLPTWANSGFVRAMSLMPRYTRAEFEVSNEDMILLVTGLSPVMYTDGQGRISPV